MRTQKECEALVKAYPDFSRQRLSALSDKERKKVKKFKKAHGFYESDTWELQISIARYALPRICYLRDHHNGYPSSLLPNPLSWEVTDELDKEKDKKWTNILDSIVNALYYILLDENDICGADMTYYVRESKRRQEVIKKGMELFGKYFTCLWD